MNRPGMNKLNATHFVIGRSCSTPTPSRFTNTPTETGSRNGSPSVRRCSITASNTGRSNYGPVLKYSSNVIAGAHSWPCLLRANWR